MNPLLEPDQPRASRSDSLAAALRAFLHDRLDLREDQAYEGQTLETVRKDVQFRGANLWILMFAILICSIGLNVNSPAVVIGAMLISPLMGPILGIGVGVAIFDFELLVTALKNLGIATLASVFVSAVYFAISPITEAQSELLARVSPTLWDVLIATFGGFAGIIAVSRREKGNALPGVAIATALMPPICTAGYAVATGQWKYFAGSLYLFSINIVFIAFATFVLARFMSFTRHTFVDEAQELRVRRWIYVIVGAVAIPSVYTAYTTVQESVFLQRATRFIEEECEFEGAEIIARQISGDRGGPRSIELVLVGQPVDPMLIADRQSRLERYALYDTELVVLQDSDDDDRRSRALEIEAQLAAREQESAYGTLYRQSQTDMVERDRRIADLETQLRVVRTAGARLEALQREAALAFGLREGSLELARLSDADTTAAPAPRYRTRGAALLGAGARLGDAEARRLARWLALRMEVDTVLVRR